ncbi:MAG: hypothetical protein AAGA56_05080 [Myxococcota bacterium]
MPYATPPSTTLLLFLAAATAACDPAPPRSPPRPSTPQAIVASTSGQDLSESTAPDSQKERRLSANEPEGDESVVGLIGTYVIRDAVLGRVHALSREEVDELKGKTMTVEATSLETPWLTCDEVTWTYASSNGASWVEGLSVAAADEARLQAKVDAVVIHWTTPCVGGHRFP